MSGEDEYTALDPDVHGVGGVIRGGLKYRDQDSIAIAGDFYAVIFFPKIEGIGPAEVSFHSIAETISRCPEAAIVKFMDRLAPGEAWEKYEAAGHKVRRISVADMGSPAGV